MVNYWHFAPWKGIWIPRSGRFCLQNPESGKFCFWKVEFQALESGIQRKESRIPLTIEIQNPSSTNEDWNLIPGIRNPWRRNHNPRLSWISLHGARQLLFLLRNKVYILRLELSKKTKYRITFLLETYSHSVGQKRQSAETTFSRLITYTLRKKTLNIVKDSRGKIPQSHENP